MIDVEMKSSSSDALEPSDRDELEAKAVSSESAPAIAAPANASSADASAKSRSCSKVMHMTTEVEKLRIRGMVHQW